MNTKWRSVAKVLVQTEFVVLAVLFAILIGIMLFVLSGRGQDFWNGLSIGVVASIFLTFQSLFASSLHSSVTKQKHHREDFADAVKVLSTNRSQVALIGGAHLIAEVVENDDSQQFLLPAIRTLEIAVREYSADSLRKWSGEVSIAHYRSADEQNGGHAAVGLADVARQALFLPKPRDSAVKEVVMRIKELRERLRPEQIQELELEEADLRDFRITELVELTKLSSRAVFDRCDLRNVNFRGCDSHELAGLPLHLDGSWINPYRWDTTFENEDGTLGRRVYAQDATEAVVKVLLERGAALFLEKNWSGARLRGVGDRYTSGMKGKCLRIAGGPGVSLDGADLRGCDFNLGFFAGASFKGADLADASFNGADLTGANFLGAKSLTVTMFRGAKLLQTKGMPDDILEQLGEL